MKRNKEVEVECILKGKVQGVGFRMFAQKRAEKYNLAGFAENEEDGSLTIVAQGEKEILESFIEEIQKGPHFSRIDSCKVLWHDLLQDTLTDFDIQ